MESANQMQLFEPEIIGPKSGQITRAVEVNIEKIIRKNLFFVKLDINNEEEYKKEINYNDPVPLKCRSNEVNNIKEKLPSLSDVQTPISAFTAVQHKYPKSEEPKLMLDLSGYGSMIMDSVNKRYEKLVNGYMEFKP